MKMGYRYAVIVAAHLHCSPNVTAVQVSGLMETHVASVPMAAYSVIGQTMGDVIYVNPGFTRGIRQTGVSILFLLDIGIVEELISSARPWILRKFSILSSRFQLTDVRYGSTERTSVIT